MIWAEGMSRIVRTQQPRLPMEWASVHQQTFDLRDLLEIHPRSWRCYTKQGLAWASDLPKCCQPFQTFWLGSQLCLLKRQLITLWADFALLWLFMAHVWKFTQLNKMSVLLLLSCFPLLALCSTDNSSVPVSQHHSSSSLNTRFHRALKALPVTTRPSRQECEASANHIHLPVMQFERDYFNIVMLFS